MSIKIQKNGLNQNKASRTLKICPSSGYCWRMDLISSTSVLLLNLAFVFLSKKRRIRNINCVRDDIKFVNFFDQSIHIYTSTWLNWLRCRAKESKGLEFDPQWPSRCELQARIQRGSSCSYITAMECKIITEMSLQDIVNSCLLYTSDAADE